MELLVLINEWMRWFLSYDSQLPRNEVREETWIREGRKRRGTIGGKKLKFERILKMIIEETINCGHKFSFDTDTKLLHVDYFDSERRFEIDINGIKTLQNMFKFLDDNKLM